MKRYMIFFLTLILASVVFAAQISGEAGYVLRYSNGHIVQALREVNISTLQLGGNFTAKVKFTILESRALSEFFAKTCHSPLFLDSAMSALTFNEMYVMYNSGDLEIKGGKFYASWGTSPVDNPVNFLEAYNLTDLFDSPVRLPITGLQVTWWNTDGSSFETDLIPVFSADLLPAHPASEEYVSSQPENFQIGARYGTFMGNYNVYLEGYHGFDHAIDGNGEHIPFNSIGAEFSGPLPMNQNYNLYGEGTFVMAKRSNVLGVIGVNGFFKGIFVGFEFERGMPAQSITATENSVLFYAKKNGDFISWKAAASLGFGGTKHGYLLNCSASYQPVQNLVLTIGGTLAGGNEYFGSLSKENGFYIQGKVYF